MASARTVAGAMMFPLLSLRESYAIRPPPILIQSIKK
jgi:hypothetical protein